MSVGEPLLNICAHMVSGYFEWVMLKRDPFFGIYVYYKRNGDL